MPIIRDNFIFFPVRIKIMKETLITIIIIVINRRRNRKNRKRKKSAVDGTFVFNFNGNHCFYFLSL